MLYYRYTVASGLVRYNLLREKRLVTKRTRRTRMGWRPAYQGPARIRLMRRFRKWKNGNQS